MLDLIHTCFLPHFAHIEIIEHTGEGYFRLRLPRKESHTIGFLLGLLSLYKKSNLSCLKLEEFQASETSLEQIFQLFAQLKLDESAKTVLIKGHQ